MMQSMSPWTQEEQFLSAPRLTKVVFGILIATVAVFIVQILAGDVFDWYGIEAVFGLQSSGVLHGRIWQFATYMFLHDRASIMHILMNMMVLCFMGPDIERALGPRRFLVLYFGSGILGGLGWFLLSLHTGGMCVGASGAVFGLLGAFAGLFPQRRITLLLFFILPLTMTAMFLAAALGVLSLAMLLIGGDGIAHAAHLAGGLAGYFYCARLAREHAFGLVDYSESYVAARPGWFGRLGDRIRAVMAKRNQPPDKAEVDRILDKVYAKGMNSLTKRERTTLDRASGLGRK